jgi:glyoxylate utilization-related uncharacterized protein
MNRIEHSLVGYDRTLERVADEFDVPDAILAKAREFARVPADDPDAMMCYPLDAARARDLAHLMGVTIDPARSDYFLEGHSAVAGDAKLHAESDFGVVDGK